MPHNLFSLITDRLMLNSSGVTLATYNVLLEVLNDFDAEESLYCYPLFVLKYNFIQLLCYPELNLCSWSSNVQLHYVPIQMVLMYIHVNWQSCSSPAVNALLMFIVLVKILTERVGSKVLTEQHLELDSNVKLENPCMYQRTCLRFHCTATIQYVLTGSEFVILF